MNRQRVGNSAELQSQFRSQLPTRIHLIMTELEAVVSGGWVPAAVEQVHQLIQDFRHAAERQHDSASSAQVALVLERALQHYLDLPAAGRTDGKWVIDQAASRFRRLIELDTAKLSRDEAEPALLTPYPAPGGRKHGFDVVLISSESVQQTELRSALRHTAYKLHLLPDVAALSSFLEVMQCDPPLAVICGGAHGKLEAVLTSAQACVPQAVSLIALSAVADLKVHRGLLRSGASHVLPANLAAGPLLTLLETCAQQWPERRLQALLLAEGPAAQHLHAALQEAEMKVQLCSDPEKCLQDASSLPFDVIVIGARVGSWCGSELAALLRSRHPQAPWALVLLAEDEDLRRPRRIYSGNEWLLSAESSAGEVARVAAASAQQKRAQHATTEALQLTLYERHLEQIALDQHAIISTTDHMGRIMYVNDTFCEISGYARQELLGESHRLVKSGVHGAEFYNDMWSTIRAGRIWRGELCNRRKDGSLYWVESTIMPFMDSDGQPYQYISMRTEITHVKETQEALERAHALLERSNEAARIGTWEIDVEGGWFTWSEMCRRIHESDRERLQLQDVLQFVAEGWSRAAALRCFCNAINRRQAFDEELLVRTERGHERWIRVVGQPLVAAGGTVAIHGLLQDIDRSKRTELALREQRDMERVITAAAAELTWASSVTLDECLNRVLGEVASFLGADTAYVAQTDESSGRHERTHEWPGSRSVPHAGSRAAQALLNGPWCSRAMAEQGVIQVDDVRAMGPAAEFEQRELEGHGVGAFLVVPMRMQGRVNGYLSFDTRGRPHAWPDRAVAQLPLFTKLVNTTLARAAAEQAAEQHKERLRIGQLFANIGTWEWVIETGELYWTERIAPLFGHHDGKVTTSYGAFIESVHPDDRGHVRRAIERCLGEEAPYEIEHRTLWPDGTVRWLQERGSVVRDDNGQALRMLGVVQDIHDRKQAEIDLAERERQLRESQRIAHLGSWSADLGDGSMWWSDEVYRIFGRSQNTFLPSLAAFYAQVHPDDVDRVRVAQRRVEALGKYELVHRIVQPDGTVRHVRIMAETRQPTEAASAVGLHGVLQDVTERVETERAMVVALDEAERASRAKSEFLSSMSHELRTPMNVILGFAQLLEYEDDLTAESHDNVREILGAGQHLLGLINEVLDLARVESGHVDLLLEDLPVDPVFQDCMNQMKVLAGRHGIHLNCEAHEGVVLHADGTRLKQVLMNLLSNAIKYNQPGGNVWLRAEVLEDNWVRICVEDDGAGIAPEFLDRLFQPFERLGAEGSEVEGTGIGLTIARRLVEMMGGLLGISSQLDQGSTFWVDMPQGRMDRVAEPDVSRELPDGKAPWAGHDQTLADRALTVLYVEDNPANLRLVEQVLAFRRDITLVTASSSLTGLELAHAHPPDLILLDIHMPEMNGYELLERLRAHSRLANVPVVALTANAMAQDLVQGRQAGFADYLTKPIDLAVFMATVDRYLSGAGSDA